MPTVTTTTGREAIPSGTGRAVAVDQACAAAVDLARTALDDLTPASSVGTHLGVEADAERVVTHLFECLLTGYVGWQWAVTVARASRSRQVSVDEAVLLPGPRSLLAPEWVPWSERLRPGDLGPGDLLPTEPDDDRLEPGWNGETADPGELAAFEARDDVADWVEVVGSLDLTRPRVLSPVGLDDAVDRWLAGDGGPDSPLALAAPATCATCGFRVAVRGRLGAAFGICANGYSPSDGRVVSLDHGCGAHSQTVAGPTAGLAGPVVDEIGYDVVPDLGDDGVAPLDEPAEDLTEEPATDPDTEPDNDADGISG